MPSKSAKQHRFMEAIAHSPEFAKKAGVPQSVGKEFAAADKGKKFAVGGPSLAKVGKQNTRHGKMDMPFSQLNRFAGMKAGGLMNKGVEKKLPTSKQMGELGMKKGGMKYARGGSIKETIGPRGMGMDVEKGSNAKRAHGEHGIQKRGHTRALEEKMTGGPKKFARGGGIESKGKTKGKMIVMKGGGYC